MSHGKSRRVRFSVFEVDLEAQEVRKHGLRIKLTRQPFQALAMMLERPGDVVTREQLRAALWPDEVWGEHDQRLNKVVNKIREALCDSAETPRFIETLPRLGYRFLTAVESIAETREAPVRSVAPVEEAVVFAPRNRWVARPWVLVAAVLVTSVVSAGLASRMMPAGVKHIPEPMPLTSWVGSELSPAVSPDGTKVAFARDGDPRPGFHIYVAPASGGGGQQITFGSGSDDAPSWSPDGRDLAFLRDTGSGTTGLYTVHSDGSGERFIRDLKSGPGTGAPVWTKDGKWLIVSQADADGTSVLFRVPMMNGEVQQLTFADRGQPGGDRSPVVSPDGSRLAFTRATSPSWRDIFVLALNRGQRPAGSPVRLTNAHHMIDHLAWTQAGASLVFSAATTTAGARHLYRVDAAASAAVPEELGIEGDYPAAGGTPEKLVFVRKNIEQSSVWKLGLQGSGRVPEQMRIFSSTRRDYTAELSPDGTQMVFSSVRSGQTDLWLAKPDGSNPKRLTSVGASSPRWSPDGRRIAFECNREGQPDVYVLLLATGAIERITSGGAPNQRPTWSRDGRFIYYSSTRSGSQQIWKVPALGGEALQLTRRGGSYAVEAFDGQQVYFVSGQRPAELRVTSVNGGEERTVLEHIAGNRGIAAGRDGLFYMSTRTAAGAQIDFFRFSDQKSQPLASVEYPVHPVLSLAPDGRAVLYSQVDRQDTDLMLLEGYSAR